MNRREFAALLAYSTAAAAAGSAGIARATEASPRTVANVMLFGGIDLRFVFMPTPDYDAGYLSALFGARRSLYADDYPDYTALFEAEYTEVRDPRSSRRIGIHRSCDYLAREFADGHVAVIANVSTSDNRRHDHSQLIVHAGKPGIPSSDTDRDGWGGRFIEAVGGDATALVLSPDVPLVAYGSLAGNRLSSAFHAADFRELALPGEDPRLTRDHPRNALVRAIDSYYRGRAADDVAGGYRKFVDNYAALRDTGDRIAARLSANPVPAAIGALTLSNRSFGLQCRNLYDSWLCKDIVNSRFVTMSYGGWDTHRSQYSSMTAQLVDLFGNGGGLQTTFAAADPSLAAEAAATVLYFASDFGRQLAANGGNGTDHGHGNYALLLGSRVRGGLYGDAFPLREARGDPASGGSSPFERRGADIEGLTSSLRVLQRTCDWAEPGTGDMVFPEAASTPIEAGVSFADLLSA